MRFKKADLTIPLILTIICYMVYPYPQIAMWCVFFFASYSAIANDSIQTIGTFIASNSDKKWYYLWIYMGGIFLITVIYSWIYYGGDISYGRLASKGLNEAPTNFQFLQVFAPVALLIMTRFKMPVSTSILLLSAFATQASSITSILSKSFFGYFIAFTLAVIVWIFTTNLFEKYKKPNLEYIESASKIVGQALKKRNNDFQEKEKFIIPIVIYDSTVYPGTTEELFLPIIKSKKLKIGKDVSIIYSPERIDPGNKNFRVDNTTKIVSGYTNECLKISK